MAGLTATETFCAMLDERGVEYHTHGTTDRTWFEVGGISWFVIERENGSLTADAVFLTPEQAIAATLGSSNCTNSERTDAACKPTTYDDGYSVDRVEPGEYYEFWEPACACGNCGELIPMRKFCPNCGRRLEVDA